MSAHPLVHWELMGPDGEQQRAFYAELFGWDLQPVEGFDGYFITTSDDSGVAGAVGQGSDQMPGYATMYFEVESIDESMSTVESGGGNVVVPRTEIPGIVTFGLFTDPSGNLVGIVEQDVPAAG